MQTLNPCTIVVDLDIPTLMDFQHNLTGNWSSISIGRELGDFLLLDESTDISRTTSKWLEDHLRAVAPGPIICTDIDILFNPVFELDPLKLFRKISRFTRLMILWPGTYKDGVLSYAQPEHHHYRFWKNLEDLEIKGVSNAL